ncbi:Uncharacterised protein [Legionella beliardensis]|uniref:Uncharacterized protein n=1 Tax=Legionella beliardensis TaxID=91822 RepID=A0A378HZJ8_9GAMM|nr:hypothetical protein [Legionella beliardensis]STX27931.1 Uncharacterised protein [Legionella beliardensis]
MEGRYEDSSPLIKIGEAASQFARSFISRGGTQMENNELDAEHLLQHFQGVEDVRNVAQMMANERLKHFNKMSNRDALEEIAQLIWFDIVNEIPMKYTVGNCDELAHLALNYVLDKTDLKAEVFRVYGGSHETNGHVFLVIGRKIPSDMSDPLTWGDDAVICDPWANKVYPAATYKENLKNYYFDKVAYKNGLEDLTDEHHVTLKGYILDTDFLRKAKDTALKEFKTFFNNEIEPIFKSLSTYRDGLAAELKTLKSFQGNEQKIIIISNKIAELNEVINDITYKKNKINQETKDYKLVQGSILTVIPEIGRNAITKMHFQPAELQILIGKASTQEQVSRFFSPPKDTQTALEEMTNKVNQEIKKW